MANLPEAARLRALEWLRDFHFTELHLHSLQIDASGGIFYTDTFTLEAAPVPSEESPVIGAAAIPVSPFPPSLKFHSRLGSLNVLYLNFAGETITSGQWLTEVGRSSIPAVAFSTDADYSTYSDAEQLAIKRIWQRVVEDYAPFDIDVTTERPATFTTRTAHALITRNTDANSDPNPYSSSGGVAYVNVFASSSYATYRPAWIYFNNLANDESYISEATSHEIGHNLGLSHDGRTDGTEYYGGHGSGDTSWGPLMGTGYNRNVSQWCKGEYYLANNTEDDLAIISSKITFRPDDRGNTAGTAASLVISGLTNILSTTPENDPTNTNSANKGVLERNTDVDVFAFTTGNGPYEPCHQDLEQPLRHHAGWQPGFAGRTPRQLRQPGADEQPRQSDHCASPNKPDRGRLLSPRPERRNRSSHQFHAHGLHDLWQHRAIFHQWLSCSFRLHCFAAG